jgi:hypothetical protein
MIPAALEYLNLDIDEPVLTAAIRDNVLVLILSDYRKFVVPVAALRPATNPNDDPENELVSDSERIAMRLEPPPATPVNRLGSPGNLAQAKRSRKKGAR